MQRKFKTGGSGSSFGFSESEIYLAAVCFGFRFRIFSGAVDTEVHGRLGSRPGANRSGASFDQAQDARL
jgi:hypothetical protein